MATAQWLLKHSPEQRRRLRARLSRKDPTIDARDASVLKEAFALIIEPRGPERPGRPMPFGIQRISSVVQGGAPGLGKR